MCSDLRDRKSEDAPYASEAFLDITVKMDRRSGSEALIESTLP
jgi:hypothetical protein